MLRRSVFLFSAPPFQTERSSNDVTADLTPAGPFFLKGVTNMDEILAEMLEGEKEKHGFGKAGTAIWILNLRVELKPRFTEVLTKTFLDMSQEELRAVKSYVQNTTWMTCPEVLDQVKVPVIPARAQMRVIDSSPWPEDTMFEKCFRKIVRWLGGQ
jgi:hypothetical protein